MPPVDSVLVLSFGGPERPEDVMDFLRNVTRGRNVPEERLAEVAEQYALFGGRSPINDQCRDLVAALDQRLAADNRELPVYFGSRNWHPFLSETVRQMARDGRRRAAVFVTSAFGSYSGCRQYQEDLTRARNEVGPAAPALDKIRLFYNHPGFLNPQIRSLERGLGSLAGCASARVVFSAHSIPQSMAAGCDYESQLNEAARLIMDGLGRDGRWADGLGAGGGRPDYDVVFQSRSGPPQIPWLEPDINDHLKTIAAQGADGVVVVPVGFTSDHMEVMFDLDTQAAQTAASLGLVFERVPTVGTDPEYVAMIVALIDELASGASPVALGSDGPWRMPCPEDHCPPPARRPAAAG